MLSLLCCPIRPWIDTKAMLAIAHILAWQQTDFQWKLEIWRGFHMFPPNPVIFVSFIGFWILGFSVRNRLGIRWNWKGSSPGLQICRHCWSEPLRRCWLMSWMVQPKGGRNLAFVEQLECFRTHKTPWSENTLQGRHEVMPLPLIYHVDPFCYTCSLPVFSRKDSPKKVCGVLTLV